MAPHRYTVYAIVATSGAKPIWELPENVDGLHSLCLWGDAPRSSGSVGHPVRALSKELLSSLLNSVDRSGSLTRLRRRTHQPPVRRDDPTTLTMSSPSEPQAAFTRLISSLADPSGGSDFLEALHDLFDLSQRQPFGGALRSSASLDSLLAAMKAMPARDRFHEGSSSVVSVADACLVLDLIECQLSPLFEPPPQVDLCHATSNGLAILPGLGAYWTYGTPLVVSEHGIYLRERYLSFDAKTYTSAVRRIMLSFFKHLTWCGYQVASAMAPGSQYNCQWLEANGCDPARIRPIYNGVDAANFIRSTSEPEEPTLVWLGRIDPLKDVETLLHTFDRVRRVMPNARLRIFGTASKENQGYLQLCENLAINLGLGDSATFEGHVESVLDAYHAGHVVLLTSISEGFPYTLIEAMAAGKPTIATDVGGVREATGGAGIIVPPQNPDQMAEACLILLRDASLRELVGRAARERILSRFTLEQSLVLFGDLYREVTGGLSSAPVLERHQNRNEEQLLEQFVEQLVEQFVGPMLESEIDHDLPSPREFYDRERNGVS